MFSLMLYRVSMFVSYDIMVRCYRPTALGRFLGFGLKWTVAQHTGRYGNGFWLLNGVQSGSTEIEIDFKKPVEATNAQVSMTYSMTWQHNVLESLNLPEYGVFAAKTVFTQLGTTIQQPKEEDLNKTLELPAVTA